jgi:hypothetical protein
VTKAVLSSSVLVTGGTAWKTEEKSAMANGGKSAKYKRQMTSRDASCFPFLITMTAPAPFPNVPNVSEVAVYPWPASCDDVVFERSPESESKFSLIFIIDRAERKVGHYVASGGLTLNHSFSWAPKTGALGVECWSCARVGGGDADCSA